MNRLQENILEVYKPVKELCDTHGLRYFAIGGTCIGAVRHEGFIPWDDDMDIAMPREDYNRFLELAKDNLPSHLEVFNGSDKDHSDFTFTKIHNNRTMFTSTFLENFPDSYTGVFLDVMPIDGLPDNETIRKKYTKKLENISRNSRRRKLLDYDAHEGQSGDDILYTLYILNLKLHPIRYYSNKLLKILPKYSFEQGEGIIFGWTADNSNRIFHKEDFLSWKSVRFEDTEVRIPIGYDRYLRKQIGDYTKLPDPDKRVTHHDAIIDLDKSYKDYARIKSEGEK